MLQSVTFMCGAYAEGAAGKDLGISAHNMHIVPAQRSLRQEIYTTTCYIAKTRMHGDPGPRSRHFGDRTAAGSMCCLAYFDWASEQPRN